MNCDVEEIGMIAIVLCLVAVVLVLVLVGSGAEAADTYGAEANERPRIGIPCAHVEPEQGKFLPNQCVYESCLNAISRAGSVCLYIPLIDDDGALRVLYDQLDGLLLMGGPDVHPREYGEDPLPGVTRIDPLRDRIELRITRWALEDDLPIFSVCRGMQVLNVAAGGTLYQDLPRQAPSDIAHRGVEPEKPGDRIAHAIECEADSRLAEVFGAREVGVNSGHHQAIKALAPGFRVTARAPDGVIEGIERERHRWVGGVQFHPEWISDQDSRMQELFTAFVRAALPGVTRRA